MTAGDLAARAQQNILVAQRDLAGQEIVVRGTVMGTTMASRNTIEVQGFGYFASAATVRESLSLVILAPGSVWCYFEPEAINDAATVTKGDAVAFVCRVDSFRPDGAHVISVLARCRRR